MSRLILKPSVIKMHASRLVYGHNLVNVSTEILYSTNLQSGR